MKRIIVFFFAIILMGLALDSCKENPLDRYVGTFRCSYVETMTSLDYGEYVLKDLSDTLINITPSSRYENGVDILFFTFIIDDEGEIVKAYGTNTEAHGYSFRVKGDSLYLNIRWGGLGSATYFDIKGVRISQSPYRAVTGS